ncbi:hypothetical protein N7499_003171 [Penicillium canescens]|uniref:Uncharacterized protein n=1 Tax=Penicillium canescens TaxID=5083 RepID=A0AAD6IBF2_PENCN|nr:uncharacterized protein N7446_012029 [Penicillium canescens]KAJ6019745.1 hypothetical protein N7522_000453 [Penicillium canescens]KAJ6039030.1 hypothetical protein N7460_007062 [Penicillium canescens]KAJ6047195.1 hypothetical protein N7446_012029 [Penicillium canescens]KAJ6093840.1 hypothetical protein N7499_003171 [Penicillium canescens]KAJ6174374.1 hypothetical protein N7485_005440 [Penicillium canescens]
MPFEQFRRNRDTANICMERMMNDASNHEILTEVLSEGRERFSDHVYELPKDQMTKLSLPDVAKYKFQLHASFDKPDQNAHYSDHSNVILVRKTEQMGTWLEPDTKPLPLLAEADGAQGLSIVLRDDSSLDWKKPPEPIVDPFVTYHIGFTNYQEQQISLLAKWVVKQLDHHELSTAADEQFVFGLAFVFFVVPTTPQILSEIL